MTKGPQIVRIKIRKTATCREALMAGQLRTMLDRSAAPPPEGECNEVVVTAVGR